MQTKKIVAVAALSVLILAIGALFAPQKAMAQDEVGFIVVDQGDPLPWQNFLVKFHWSIAGWETSWREHDDWNGDGDYFWNIPDPDPLKGVIDGWEALCPSGLPEPTSPLGYNLTLWFDLDPMWFTWVIRPDPLR